MLNIIKKQLLKMISDIDAGNCYLSEEEEVEVIKLMNKISRKDRKLSKYEACKYLNISRASFDNYVRQGLLPKGIKTQGFKELFWSIKDLDNFNKLKK